MVSRNASALATPAGTPGTPGTPDVAARPALNEQFVSPPTRFDTLIPCLSRIMDERSI